MGFITRPEKRRTALAAAGRLLSVASVSVKRRRRRRRRQRLDGLACCSVQCCLGDRILLQVSGLLLRLSSFWRFYFFSRPGFAFPPVCSLPCEEDVKALSDFFFLERYVKRM